eukprot:scaffold38063_cov75-Phaeocystis_antarctica.AAC.1
MARRNVADGTGANRVWAVEQCRFSSHPYTVSLWVGGPASWKCASLSAVAGDTFLLTSVLTHAATCVLTGVRQAHGRRPSITSAAREPDTAGAARYALRPRQEKPVSQSK